MTMLNVLIADDEKIAREGIRDLVEWSQMDMRVVYCAENGRDALDYMLTHPVDILLTDIRMPVMDGLTLLHEMHESPLSPACVIFSGFDDFSYARQAIHYGVVSYLLKPINMDELAEALKKAADRYRMTHVQPPTKEEMTRYRMDIRSKAHAQADLVCRAINSSDSRALKDGMDGLCTLLEESGFSTDMMRRAAFSAVYRMSRTLARYTGEEADEDMERLTNLASARDAADILNALRAFIVEASARMAKKTEHRQKYIVQELKTMIRQQYQKEDLSIASLADAVGLSPNYLSSLFHQQTGQTFSEYLEGCRIEMAQELLRNTTLKIYEIAQRVGYADAKYFSRVFKQATGQTALKYRDLYG